MVQSERAYRSRTKTLAPRERAFGLAGDKATCAHNLEASVELEAEE